MNYFKTIEFQKKKNGGWIQIQHVEKPKAGPRVPPRATHADHHARPRTGHHVRRAPFSGFPDFSIFSLQLSELRLSSIPHQTRLFKSHIEARNVGNKTMPRWGRVIVSVGRKNGLKVSQWPRFHFFYRNLEKFPLRLFRNNHLPKQV